MRTQTPVSIWRERSYAFEEQLRLEKEKTAMLMKACKEATGSLEENKRYTAMDILYEAIAKVEYR